MIKQHKIFNYAILILSISALIFANILELFDIHPCRLCLYQRYVYYTIIIVEITMLMHKTYFKYYSIITCILIIIGIGIGVFQVLIENKLIQYDSSCTATTSNISTPQDLLNAINAKDLVACDTPQIEIFRLSLSLWNIIYMLFMLAISFFIIYKKNFLKN